MPTPLPEKAVMVRALGEWHAIGGSWEQAHQRFEYVQHAAPDLSGLDYLNDSIALLESGDEAGFLHLREEAINRFQDTDKTDIAQRVLELALLRPISKTSVGGLDRLPRFWPTSWQLLTKIGRKPPSTTRGTRCCSGSCSIGAVTTPKLWSCAGKALRPPTSLFHCPPPPIA